MKHVFTVKKKKNLGVYLTKLLNIYQNIWKGHYNHETML